MHDTNLALVGGPRRRAGAPERRRAGLTLPAAHVCVAAVALAVGVGAQSMGYGIPIPGLDPSAAPGNWTLAKRQTQSCLVPQLAVCGAFCIPAGVVCCGAGFWCPAGTSCVAATSTCTPCTSLCPNRCETIASLQVSTNNCGACGVTCPIPTGGLAYCSGGKCGTACPSGTAISGNACVATTLPVCPADTTLTLVGPGATAGYVYRTPSGTQCSGCPGEGKQTVWNNAALQCQTVRTSTAPPPQTTTLRPTTAPTPSSTTVAPRPSTSTAPPSRTSTTTTRPVSTSSATTTTITKTPCLPDSACYIDGDKPADKTGIIVGGTVGGVAAVGIVGVAAAMMMRKRQAPSPPSQPKYEREFPPPSAALSAALSAAPSSAPGGPGEWTFYGQPGPFPAPQMAQLQPAPSPQLQPAAAYALPVVQVTPPQGYGYTQTGPTGFPLQPGGSPPFQAAATPAQVHAAAAAAGAAGGFALGSTALSVASRDSADVRGPAPAPSVGSSTLSLQPHWFFARIAAPIGQMNASSVPYEGPGMPAVQKHSPLAEDEIAIFPGNLVFVREVFRDGWAVGQNNETGAYGLFPVDCLRVADLAPPSMPNLTGFPASLAPIVPRGESGSAAVSSKVLASRRVLAGGFGAETVAFGASAGSGASEGMQTVAFGAPGYA